MKCPQMPPASLARRSLFRALLGGLAGLLGLKAASAAEKPSAPSCGPWLTFSNMAAPSTRIRIYRNGGVPSVTPPERR